MVNDVTSHYHYHYFCCFVLVAISSQIKFVYYFLVSICYGTHIIAHKIALSYHSLLIWIAFPTFIQYQFSISLFLTALDLLLWYLLMMQSEEEPQYRILGMHFLAMLGYGMSDYWDECKQNLYPNADHL